jgi:hypothetical protein
LVVLTILLALPAAALAAKPVERFHDRFTDSFSENVCGIDVETTLIVVDNFTLYDDGSFADQSSVRITFTNPENGKVVKLSSAGLIKGTAVIDEEAGTITFSDDFRGLPEKLQTEHGSVLLRDAGIIVFTDTFDLETGDFISGEVVIKGPHPEAESDFELFCEVVTEGLT